MQLFSVLQVKVLMTVGVPSDLQGSWNLLPIPRVDAPAEPCLSLQGCLTLQRQDAGQTSPLEAGGRQSSVQPSTMQNALRAQDKVPPASHACDHEQIQHPPGCPHTMESKVKCPVQ